MIQPSFGLSKPRNPISASKSRAFTPANSPTPDLRAAWRDPDVRFRLEKLIRQGMMKNSPVLAEEFLSKLDSLCQTSLPNEQLYGNLADFLQTQENKKLFKARYAADESARYQRRMDQVIQLLPPGTRPKRFLDIGCGTGELTRMLAEHWKLPKQDVYGLEAFARPVADLRFRYEVFDGTHIPLPGGAFDFASMFMVLHHANEPERLIGEAFRVLKPGGLLMVREMNAPTPSSKLFHDVLDHLYYKVFNNLPGIPTPANHLDVDTWQRRFEKAGFKIEKTVYPEPDNPVSPVHFLLRKPL